MRGDRAAKKDLRAFARVLPEGEGPNGWRAPAGYLQRYFFSRVAVAPTGFEICGGVAVATHGEAEPMDKTSKRKPASKARHDGLFSISAASDLLNRSRRTITRALIGVRPDMIKSGLKLWRLARIITAVNENTAAPLLTKSGGGALAAETEAAFERYHAAEAEMRALPTIAARRAAAPELALMAKEALELMHDRDVACDLHPEHVELKNQAVTLLIVKGLEAVCEWTHSQAWDCFNADDGEDSEAA